MPLERITFHIQTWRKLQSAANRDKNLELKKQLGLLGRVTENSKGDKIVWEPTEDFKKAVVDVLTVELTFMRKPDSASNKFIQEAIQLCQPKVQPA